MICKACGIKVIDSDICVNCVDDESRCYNERCFKRLLEDFGLSDSIDIIQKHFEVKITCKKIVDNDY